MNLTQKAAIGLLALSTLGVAGCGTNGTSGSSGIKIALSLSTLNNPYFVKLKAGAEAEAKALGVNLQTQDAQNDSSTQVNQIQTFTTQGYQAIILNPVDSDQAVSAVKAANLANIPVVTADRGVNGGTVAAAVASDNTQGGKLAAGALLDAVGAGGTVAELQGTTGTSASRERGAGFADGATGKLTIAAKQPADFDRTKGLDVTTNLLQANAGIKGIFAENDEMALGAIAALGSKAGQDVKVVGFDATDDGLKAVKAGTLAATIAQNPTEIGKQAVDQAVNAAKGKGATAKVLIPVSVVTSKNIAEYLK